MAPEIIAIISSVVLVFAYQIYVAYRVMIFDIWSLPRKIVLALICLLVPLFPAVFLHAFLSSEGKPLPQRDVRFTEQGRND
jgi:hypothetical protein